MANLRERFRRSERGATVAMAAVGLAALLSILALCVDLAMLFKARVDAQKAADSSALAGASAFLDVLGPTVEDTARTRAYDYAAANVIHGTAIDTAEVNVEVDTAAAEVYVRVERRDIPLWFARLFGIPTSDVMAAATAAARPAGSGKCLAPLAIPDYWHDEDDDTNGNRIWDAAEDWDIGSDPADRYAKFTGAPSAIPPETGLGSAYRDTLGMPAYTADFGRDMLIKPQNPQQSPTAGFFYPFRIGESSGAQDYESNFLTCNPAQVDLGVPIDLEMGNMVGPTKQAINALVALDPSAQWDPVSGQVVNSNATHWLGSPRILLVALFDPTQIPTIHGQASGGGHPTVVFNDFALYFVEGMGQGGNNAPVIGRFLYFATGTGVPTGGQTGSLVRVLQLIK